MGATTSRLGDRFITAFTPELAEPERPRREKLIGEAKALTAANVAGASQPSLVYRAYLENREFEGGLHTVMVVASWRLVYCVQAVANGVNVDAYTGEIVDRWSNVAR
jgi:hypothetical protein